MSWWELFASEFAITVANPDVWRPIGLALLLGGACWACGTWVARTVGLLEVGAPAGETLGVGLAAGLMVVAAWWAAIWSGGQSSFTPVALGFAIAIVLALVGRRQRRDAEDARLERSAVGCTEGTRATWLARHRSLILTGVVAGLFVVAIALVYGSTMAPSPRDGVQPVEFVDEAFYSVLARDLAATGIETNLSATGFDELPGLPVQSWYHWGELWLGALIIKILATAPIATHFFIVLPLVLLAGAALTGTLVRRLSGTNSRWAYVFGVLAWLFLAPMPLIKGPFFSSSAVGMIFGVTSYGLGAVAALLALYTVAVLHRRPPRWESAVYVATSVAFIMPAHMAVAVLGLVGVAGVWSIRIFQRIMRSRALPAVPAIWRRTSIVAAASIVVTLTWGLLTGHNVGGVSSPLVSPFNASWQGSVAITLVGTGVMLAIPLGWLLRRGQESIRSDLYLFAIGLVVAGAIGWGARLGDFTMFYLFFGAISVFATPIAALAVRDLWERLQTTQYARLAVVLVVLVGVQLQIGVATGIVRMQLFGPHEYAPISTRLLGAIKQLPADAKLAYACHPMEEVGFATPRLLTIDAHAGRRVMPLCFEAEVLSTLIGAEPNENVENLFFKVAPQRQLYPTRDARPSSADVASFLKEHGVHYIYADARHPNSLVEGAISIAKDGSAEVLKIP